MYELCCLYSDHSKLYFYLISAFLHTVLYFIKKMIHCYEFCASPVISKPRYFDFFFHFPWDFEIAGFDCTCNVNYSGPRRALGSFSDDDGDGYENVKKAKGLSSKTTILHVPHALVFVYFFAVPARLQLENA